MILLVEAYTKGAHTRINSMQVVQVRSEAESFDGPFDVLLDMGGRIGHSALTKDIKTAL
jgi:hypothetical protein